MDGQTTIFDMLYPKYKIKNKIRTIELFGGYGSQLMAIKRLTNNVEQWKLCEWAVKSIQAYKDVHFTDDDKDYSKDLSIKEIKEYLFKKGISSNYNEPMSESQVNRLNEKQARTIYNNIIATHNLVNIQQVKGKDLEIENTDKYDYILTYSFPCQDLSLAGKGKGFDDTSTRSGMLWEVERILSECKELGTLPQILLMENVPMIHSEANNNNDNFNKWQLRLEELGYKNYWQDLIATDYEIPQIRNRCFMISILGDYSYTFPKPIPLKLKLKDMLEDNVDEKYYISDDLMKHIQKTKEEHKEYTQYERYNGEFEQMARVWKEKSPTLHTKSNEIKIYVKNATKKGYLEATDGDGIDISSRMEYHRGTVQKGKTQTLTTMGGENNGVVVNPLKGISGKSWQFEQQVYDENGSARTLKASEGSGNIPKVVNNLRIRKLTPKECFRLMGVKDEDFEKCAKNQSDSSLYHLAGDSIVVDVLYYLFKQLIEEEI